jgi:hypothetical protein
MIMNPLAPKFWIAGLIAMLAWLLIAGGVATGQTLPPDDMIFSGFLSCSGDDAKDPNRRCPFRLHYVQLTQGNTYAFRIEATEFDSRLTIEDQHGNVLAQDTDCLEEDVFGCIYFRPPVSGRYRLVVTSLPPLREGFYQVTMRQLPIEMRVESELTIRDPSQDNCFYRVHEVALREGERYIIDLESKEYANCVKLLNPDGMIVAFQDEGTPSRGARIIYEAPRTGTYRVLTASTTPNAIGPFTLTVCRD